MKKMREGLKMENIKKMSLNNLKEELKRKKIKLELTVKRKKDKSNPDDPFFSVCVPILCPIFLIMAFITVIPFGVIFFLGIIQMIVYISIISVILIIWFIYVYIIYYTPVKLKRECRELEIKILQINRNISKENKENEIKTIKENISCLIKEGEKCIIRKNFHDAYEKFENALKIFKTAQNKYAQEKIIPIKKNGWTSFSKKLPKIFDENIENVLNSKIEIVENKINEEILKKIKLNIKKGETLKNQIKIEDALQEYQKALNIANEMLANNFFTQVQISKKVEELQLKIDEIYSIKIDRLIEQGNQLKSQKSFDKTIRILNSALDLSYKIYNSIDKDKAQNKIKNCFDSLYSDMIREKIKTGNQLRKDLQYDDPIKIFRESIKIAEKLNDSSKKNDKISQLKSLIHQTQIAKIKNTILSLGTKFGRLQIIEISEECGESEDLIISTVREMIEGSEIYAKYFESSKSVAFDQQANIKEIDKLMDQYLQWEKEGISKK